LFLSIDKKKSDDQPLGKERYELESSSFLLKRLKSRIQLEAGMRNLFPIKKLKK